MRPAEIKALTSLRGLAALWVFVFHLRHEIKKLFPGEHSWADPAIQSGFLGVDLFFVLSGLVIGLVYAPALERPEWSSYTSFVRRRFARIYPAYLVALLLVVLVFAGFQWFEYDYHRPGRFTPGSLIESVLMVQAWTYPARSNWNVPDWSVSAEWLAYLCFPGIAAVVRPLRSRWSVVLALVVVLGANTWALHLIDRDGGSAMALALLRVAAGFCVGVLLYRLRVHLPLRSRAWLVLALVCAAAVPVLYAISKERGIDPLMWAPAVFGVLVLALSGPGAQSRILTSRVPVYLGSISYSIYLVHDVVLLAVRAIYNSREVANSALHVKLAYLAAITAVVIALAAALHRWVETPWRTRLGGRDVHGS